MTLSAILVGCNDDDHPQAVLGDWYAEYAATGTTDNGAYDRVVQAYHFDSDGTGYWYNIFLADDRDEPVAMKGGHNIGRFTYTVSDGNINIHLDWTGEEENPSWALSSGEGVLVGSNGGTDYTLTPATAEQMEWCGVWDEITNGGNESYGIVMEMEKYTEETSEGQIQTTNGIKWNLGYRLTVGNDDKNATISNVVVFPVYDVAYLLRSFVSKFADKEPLWAATGMQLVAQTSASSATYRFPNTYSCMMSSAGIQTISVPLVAYTQAKGDSLHFRHVGAAVSANIANSTPNALTVDEVIVKSKNYKLSSDALTLNYDEDNMHYTPETATNEEEHISKLQFPSTGALAFKIQPNNSNSVVVPILPIGNDELTVEVRCHFACEGLTDAETSCVYSQTFEVEALSRAQLLRTKADIAIGAENVEARAFSVSATKAVYFAKGNLMAHCTKFETDPGYDFGYWKAWEFVLCDNQYATVEDDGECDSSYRNIEYMSLFSYGSTGYDNGQICWKPCSTLYMGRYGNYDTDTGAPYWFNGALTATAEWGYNAITNAGNAENSGWRTLTATEWDYVIRHRANAASKKGLANVNSVNGLILLPDHFTLPDGLIWNGGATEYSGNTYTAGQWAEMEAAGAIFLPAGGERYSDLSDYTGFGLPFPAVHKKGSEGLYWASTDSGNRDYADMLYFYRGEITTGNQNKSNGCNVRLVRNAN